MWNFLKCSKILLFLSEPIKMKTSIFLIASASLSLVIPLSFCSSFRSSVAVSVPVFPVPCCSVSCSVYAFCSSAPLFHCLSTSLFILLILYSFVFLILHSLKVQTLSILKASTFIFRWWNIIVRETSLIACKEVNSKENQPKRPEY